MEKAWDVGDGLQRWVRGISQPRFLACLIKAETLVYVVGCHIKFVRLANPMSEVLHVFSPAVNGIGLLEGHPVEGVFAIADICLRPRVLIYKFDKMQEVLVAQLKGCAETEIRAVRFTKKDLLIVHTGAPEFSVSVWKWALEQIVVAVSSFPGYLHSDIQVSKFNFHYWIQWGAQHLTFYELQSFTESDLIRTELSIPENDFQDFTPDHRLGSKYAFDILSTAWSETGDFYVLDEYRTIHKLDILERVLKPVGVISYTRDNYIYKIVPYDKFLAAIVDDGAFLILGFHERKAEVMITKAKLKFASPILVFIPNPTAAHPLTSFYAITEKEKRVECVMHGKIRTGHHILDFQFCEIKAFCFIEPEADYMAVVTEKGLVIILDTKNGNIFCRWKLPYFACTVQSHPLLKYLVVGSMDGCAYFMDISTIQTPRMVHRSFFHEEAVIDTLAFMCRGRLLVAADSRCGLMFLQFAIPSMEFEYLDHTNMEGTIRVLNLPSNYKDKRFQVLVQRDKGDEVPLVVNNYRLDGDCFDIVASQYLDCSVKTMCFSNYKRHIYVYSAEFGLGMTQFTEDMNAGSLKEPEITFDCDLKLDVNRVKLYSGVLYTFGQDGVIRTHDPPAPKTHVVEINSAIRTHFPAYEGIQEGILSMNGRHLAIFGYDNSLVHVDLKSKKAGIDWGALQFGTETSVRRMIEQQKIYAEAQKKVWPPLGEYEQSLSFLAIKEAETYEIRSTEEEVRTILDGLADIRKKVGSLMALNDSYEEFEMVPLEEFELDEEEEEESRLAFEQTRKTTETLVLACAEEREQWADEMKGFLYKQFEVKSCTLKGFGYDKEISNYPLRPMDHEFALAAAEVKEEKRLEKKLLKSKKEIVRLQMNHIFELRKMRKLSKKKKPKRKLDYSRFPPGMREEMRSLFEELETPPDSHSSTDLESDAEKGQGDMEDFFERLLKKQSSMQERERLEEAEAEKKRQALMAKAESKALAKAEHSDDDEEENEEDEEDEEEAEEEAAEEAAQVPTTGGTAEDEQQSSGSSEESEGGGSDSTIDGDSPHAAKKKLKNRIFFGRPSKQALQAQGIPSKDAEIIAARAERAAEAQEKARAEKEEQAKLAKQREMEEMERHRQAAFMARHNLKVGDHSKPAGADVITLVAPKSPRLHSGSDMDGEEEDGQDYFDGRERGKRKRIRVKRTIVENDVETEVWVSESDSSEESDEELQKDINLEKAMEDYKLKYMSNTQIARNLFIKNFENGGRVHNFFEPSPGLHPQMEIISLQHHLMQIDVILFDLRKLKTVFNTEFETVHRMKDATVKAIMARNERIREISDYLNLEMEVPDPENYIWERTENIFNVTNAEVPLEPYLTAAEREEAERLRLEEEARRLAKSEDFRERALITMMDGVLESRREDVLKKDVPKPRFMLVKEQWEWNFEDYRRADDYYALVEQLEALREEFRKELEIEIRQLIKLNADSRNLFDRRLAQLFTYKWSIEHAVRLEEMKIIRLTRQLTKRYHYQRREDIQSALLRKMQERMKEAKSLGAQISARVVTCSEQYEEILEHEKILQSEFRGSMTDAGPYMETFVRLYKKSPKLNIKPEKLTELLVLMIKGLDSSNLRVFANEHGELGHIAADAIFELDEPIQIPVGCPRATWDRFCRLRRNRIIAEFEAKVTGTELVQLKAVVTECKVREDEIAHEMAEVLAKMSAQKNLKVFIIQNGEMQMVISQGRIEADLVRATDFQDIAICKTSVIQKLNDFIKSYTATLVTQLAKSKIQHREILQIDWKFRKINLREKNLSDKIKDISTLRVTKEVLEFLWLHNDFRSMQDRRLLRIKKLQEMAELYHVRYMEGQTRLQNIIQSGVNRFEKDSLRKGTKLEKKNVRYNTLKVKCNIENPELSEKKRVERMQMIMRIGHMARLYSQFEETILTLETELERLYDKTYPYL